MNIFEKEHCNTNFSSFKFVDFSKLLEMNFQINSAKIRIRTGYSIKKSQIF